MWTREAKPGKLVRVSPAKNAHPLPRVGDGTAPADFDDDWSEDYPAAKLPWFTRDLPLGLFLVVTAAIGFLASFDLSIDKVKKLENPERKLSCDFNPFFSCGNVMEHWQSQLFGFPNQFLGIMAFVVPLLLGVLLLSRTRIPTWVMIGLNIGLAAGTAFVMFLFISSIYVIGIGCPWCIVVWTVTIPMFCIVTAANALTGAFGARVAQSTATYVIGSNAVLLAVVWMLVIYGCIVSRFWVYFSSFL